MPIEGPKKGQRAEPVRTANVTKQESPTQNKLSDTRPSVELPAHIGLFNRARDSRPTPKVAELKHKLGQDSFPEAELQGLTPHLFAEHLMLLLANRRKSKSRTSVMEEIATMLIHLEDPERARKILALMPKVGRIVDIYPLELLDYLLRESPDSITGHSRHGFIKNRSELEAKVFKLGDTIELRVPLALKLQSFALKGGGSPGYTLAPGPPGVYWIELGQAGEYRLLFQGQMRRQSFVDTLLVRLQA